jgi:sugar phosphate permease
VTLLPWGLVADRIGERRVLAAGLSGCAVALVVAGRTSSFGGLVAALAAAGALGGGVQSASGRAVMSWFAPHERGLALGIRQTAVPVGGAIAAVVLPALAAHISLGSAFDALAIGCGIGAATGAVLIRRETNMQTSHDGDARPLKDARVWLLCLGSTFYVTTQIALVGFLVLFLHDERGLSTGLAAAALAAIQVLGGVARIATGRWSDRTGRRIAPLRLVALWLAAAMAAAAVLVPAGTFALSWNGLSDTAAAEMAGRARSGSAIGLQQTFLSAGSIAAPIAFAAFVHHTSWRAGFWLAALSPLVGYAVLSPLAERRP